MARAGFCDQCQANVWVNPDGSCVNGHSAEHVSGIYETPEPGAPVPPAQAPAAKSSNKTVIIIVALVVALFLCMICGIAAAIAIPVFNAAKANAETKSCWANQRTYEGASQVYAADNGKLPDTLDLLVPAYIKAPMLCPAGGTYEYAALDTEDELIPTTIVTCSIHGHFDDTTETP